MKAKLKMNDEALTAIQTEWNVYIADFLPEIEEWIDLHTQRRGPRSPVHEAQKVLDACPNSRTFIEVLNGQFKDCTETQPNPQIVSDAHKMLSALRTILTYEATLRDKELEQPLDKKMHNATFFSNLARNLNNAGIKRIDTLLKRPVPVEKREYLIQEKRRLEKQQQEYTPLSQMEGMDRITASEKAKCLENAELIDKALALITKLAAENNINLNPEQKRGWFHS